MPNKFYGRELIRLQVELVKLQEWISKSGLGIVVVFEGHDAPVKGWVIKRIIQHLNPHKCNIVTLPTPTEQKKMQWYVWRYVAHLPVAGEIALICDPSIGTTPSEKTPPNWTDVSLGSMTCVSPAAARDR